MTAPASPPLRPTAAKVAAGGAAASGVAAIVLLASPLVEKWEGLRNDPYRDLGGVWTVCIGETGVPMRRYTDAECRAMLAKSLTKHGGAVELCMPASTPAPTKAAFYSFAYNVGPTAACGSTAVKRLWAGDIAGACAQLDRWVYVKGKRVQGLVNRRREERAMCERGLQ